MPKSLKDMLDQVGALLKVNASQLGITMSPESAVRFPTAYVGVTLNGESVPLYGVNELVERIRRLCSRVGHVESKPCFLDDSVVHSGMVTISDHEPVQDQHKVVVVVFPSSTALRARSGLDMEQMTFDIDEVPELRFA